MRICSNLDIQQIFISYNIPKGNADTERMIRTIKEELFWLREWESEKELSLELDKWVKITTGITFIRLLDTAHRFRGE